MAKEELLKRDGDCLVNITSRADSPNFQFEIFVQGRRVRRGSTGTSDREQARKIAREKFDDLMSDLRRGKPLNEPRIGELVRRHLDSRREDAEQKAVTQKTVEQAEIVLTNYFTVWCDRTGIGRLSDIGDVHIRRYVQWRRKFRHEGEHITYMRNGRQVRARRPASHFRALSNTSLNKQLDPLRRLFRWAVEEGILENRHLPKIPNFERSKSLDPDDPGSLSNPGKWFRPEEWVKLVQTALDNSVNALHRHNHAYNAYGPGYQARLNPSIERYSVSKKAFDAQLLFAWVLLLSKAGLRPSEADRLRWKHIAKHEFKPTGIIGLTLQVYGKGRWREVVVQEQLRNLIYGLADLQSLSLIEAGEVQNSGGKDRQERVFDQVISSKIAKESKIFPYKSFRRSFSKLVKDADIGRDGFTPYSLRHTYINMELLKGRPVNDVALLAGNSVQVIDRFYNALKPLMIAERDIIQRAAEADEKIEELDPWR